MADSFIIYTPNPPSISTLTSSGKQSLWLKIQKNIEKILEGYKKNDFSHQELMLCDIIDKPWESMSHNHFLKIIKKFIDKIKDECKDYNIKPEPITFNKPDSNIFNLTYKNIISLVNIIIYILENITSKGKLCDIVYDFAYKGTIPKFKDVMIFNHLLSKIIIQLDSIKTINICLYKENEEVFTNILKKKNSKDLSNNYKFKMDEKIIIFFTIFFNALFKSVINFVIDLNIKPIDDYFKSNMNPYLINENQILELGNYYKDIFISNLILIKNLPHFSFLANLKFQMHDSYQIELHNILSNALIDFIVDDIECVKKHRSKSTISSGKPPIARKNTDKEVEINKLYSPKFNNNYLYIQHLLSLSESSNISEFQMDFNSLDPLLFNSVNYLLSKYNNIAKLKLIFFPHNKINKRKIYINNIFYNKYANNDDVHSNLYSIDDKKIYYQYIEQNEKNSNDNNYILKDEKLLNELFYSFNMNLRMLSIILEKKITELLSLKIDFGTYNNKSISLFNYDNYNCSIVCFIFDLFRTFQSQKHDCKINSLKIVYEDFLDEKSFIVETIKRKIPSCKNGFKLNDLKLNNIHFNISNISLFLPFENFPSVSLTELILNNLTSNDLNNLVMAFKKNKNMFPALIKLDISLAIIVEDYTKSLEILLRECLSPELVYFNMTIPFNISIYQLIDMIYWIKCNHNVETNIYLKIVNSQLSQHIDHYYFKNVVVELFKKYQNYFRQKKLLPEFEVSNEHTINFKINKYNKKDIDYYYKFIYCFNRVYSNSNNNINCSKQKIFEKVFNFIGKFKKYEVDIEIFN